MNIEMVNGELELKLRLTYNEARILRDGLSRTGSDAATAFFAAVDSTEFIPDGACALLDALTTSLYSALSEALGEQV